MLNQLLPLPLVLFFALGWFGSSQRVFTPINDAKPEDKVKSIFGTHGGNPADQKCEEFGGKVEIRKHEGETSFCVFNDGSECDAWEFFRSDCKAGVHFPKKTEEVPVMGGGKTGNPASLLCVKKGGRSVIKKEKKGEVGYCVFSDGSECEEWDLFHSKCAAFSNKKKDKFCPKKFCEVFLRACTHHDFKGRAGVSDMCFESVQKLGMAPPVGDACSCGRKETHFKSGADVCDDCIHAVGRWARSNCNKPHTIGSEEHHHNHDKEKHGDHEGHDFHGMHMNHEENMNRGKAGGEEDRNSFVHHGHQRKGEDDRRHEHEREHGHGNFWFHIFFWENLFLLCGLCLCCAKRRRERVARRRERRQRHRSSSSSSTAKHQFVPLQTAVVTQDSASFSSGPSAPVVMMAVPIEQSAIAI